MLSRLRKSVTNKPDERPKAYRIFDVKNHHEGYLRLRPLLFFAAVVFVNGGLNVLYELVILNVEDRDTRDLLFDQRVTQQGTQEHHHNFRTAAWKWIDFTNNALPPSRDLPVINYRNWEPGCYFETLVPCLTHSHEDRPWEAGWLNIGTDYGAWPVAPGFTLVRNETFSGLINRTIYRYETFEDFVAAMPESIQHVRSFPMREVPVPLKINITRRAQFNLWTQHDWKEYVNATWSDILQVQCERKFDLCGQTEAVFPIAVEQLPGLIHFNLDIMNPFETWPLLEKEKWPSLEIYRKEFRHDPTLDIGLTATTGYVNPQMILDYAIEAERNHSVDWSYVRPSPPVSLAEATYIAGMQIPMMMVEVQHPYVNYMGWESDIWYWPTPCSWTDSTQYYLEGTAADLYRPEFDPQNMPTLEVSIMYQNWWVDWYTFESDYDDNIITVKGLTELTIWLSFTSIRGEADAWKLNRVEGHYEEVWSGPIDRAPTSVTAEWMSVQAYVRDISQPERTTIPRMHGYYRVHYSLAMGAAFALILLSMPYFLYLIHRNVMENNNLPPPFYHQRLEYRGW